MKNKKSGNFFSARIFWLFIFFLVVVAAIFLRLYFLQIFSFDSYKALAEGQHTFFEKLVPVRGEIFFNNKNISSEEAIHIQSEKEGNDFYPAAVNRGSKMAYAVPREIEDYRKTVDELVEILKIDKDRLLERLGDVNDGYEPLKRRLGDDEIEKLKEVKLKGVYLAEESYRYYPSGELAASVLGFVGWRDNDFGGRYGSEAYFEKQLKGEEGKIVHERDAGGRKIFFAKNEVTQAKNGNDIILTIDHIAQYATEKILRSAIEKFDGESGSIIVMDPKTGKIISIANYPTFNPNEYSKIEDIGAYRNYAVSDSYECGSIFKPFTMAAGIDSGKISANTEYNDTGSIVEAGYTIRNSDLKSNGTQTMTQVLEKSLNTGVIFVEKALGNKNFADYVKRFGFGELTGIDLIGESAANLNNLNNLKSDIQFFTASFGQGISVTPIQLAAAYGALANGGVLMKPQIVEKIIHSDGSVENIEPKEIRRVISEKTSMEMRDILRSVVVNGHGKRADVPGYLVAGKTGTAQVASVEKRGYEEGRKIGSFAGFAPVQDPRFVILVKIDNPKNVEWAESSAAPAFGELMKFLLEYYNIEPTEKYTQADLDKFDATHNLKELFIKKEEEKQQQDNSEINNEKE